MSTRRWGIGVVALALAACASEQVTSNTGPVLTLPPSVAPTSTAATTSPMPPATPLPSSTVPATPPTTPAATTVAPTPPPPGWAVTDLRPRAFVQGYSGNWAGDGDARSPAWPANPAATPADGFYSAALTAPWEPGDTVLHVRVQRLELCTALPVDTCYPSTDPTELGADPAAARDIEVPLDSSTRVVVTGFDCFDDVPTSSPAESPPADDQNKIGKGTQLGELFEAYAAEYAAVIDPPLTAGVDLYANPEQFAGGPDDGFRTEAEVCPDPPTGNAGPLRFVHADAPMLLLQSVVDWEGNSLDAHELVQLDGVWFAGGSPIFMFYAGFYS
jgi:hypothetical protein